MNNLSNFQKFLNIVLVGSNTNEKVFNYFDFHKTFNKSMINSFNEKEVTSILHKLATNFEIVSSKSAGIGKSFYIEQKSLEKKLEPKYFPIAGNITKQRIVERLCALKIKENTSLIVQLHNFVDKKILDEILFQLIFFRSLVGEGFLFCPLKKLQLFVEIQNVLGENYFQSLQSLNIFENTDFVHFIEKTDPNILQIDYNNKEFLFF